MTTLSYHFFWIFVHVSITMTSGYVDVLFTQEAYSPHTLIKKYGYPMETNHIQTPDGFILELQRIPRGSNVVKGNHFPILLLHGFIDSSYTWIANGPGRSLAYLLADQGYDVWMMNFRGNFFSCKHVDFTSNEAKFWNFSFHEMAIYDLPTAIDFILNKTNHSQLLVICHSAGNAVFHMMLSQLPQYNKKIIAQVGLGPYYHPKISSRSIISSITPIFLEWNILGPFFERTLPTKLGLQIATAVQLFSDGYTLFDFALYLAYGLRHDYVNREIMPGVYNNFPSGTSLKVVQHLSQLHQSFSFFDYGPAENLKLYGTLSPPEYDLSKIQTPVRIYHARHDVASNPQEVQILYDGLPIKAGLVEIPDHNYSHMDFVYNRENNYLLNNDVLDFVNSTITNISKSIRRRGNADETI